MSARNRFGKRLGLGFGTAMLALFTAGCIDDFDKVGDGQFGSGGPSCASVCERAAECEGSDDLADCTNSCEEIERIVRRANCEEDFDDFMSCASDLPDICRASEDQCAAETEAYSSCLLGYCNRYPDDCGVIYD
jgi:hypothetical protein